jgi:hypothetical protein
VLVKGRAREEGKEDAPVDGMCCGAFIKGSRAASSASEGREGRKREDNASNVVSPPKKSRHSVVIAVVFT